MVGREVARVEDRFRDAAIVCYIPAGNDAGGDQWRVLQAEIESNTIPAHIIELWADRILVIAHLL